MPFVIITSKVPLLLLQLSFSNICTLPTCQREILGGGTCLGLARTVCVNLTRTVHSVNPDQKYRLYTVYISSWGNVGPSAHTHTHTYTHAHTQTLALLHTHVDRVQTFAVIPHASNRLGRCKKYRVGLNQTKVFTAVYYLFFTADFHGVRIHTVYDIRFICIYGLYAVRRIYTFTEISCTVLANPK